MLKLGNINVRKFKLSEQFISKYKEAEVPWGPVGYVTFKRTYARRLAEFEEGAVGTEEWWQSCRRVVEGMLIFKSVMRFLSELSGMTQKLREQQRRHMIAFSILSGPHRVVDFG